MVSLALVTSCGMLGRQFWRVWGHCQTHIIRETSQKMSTVNFATFVTLISSLKLLLFTYIESIVVDNLPYSLDHNLSERRRSPVNVRRRIGSSGTLLDASSARALVEQESVDERSKVSLLVGWERAVVVVA
jgi:hypothetical protein